MAANFLSLKFAAKKSFFLVQQKIYLVDFKKLFLKSQWPEGKSSNLKLIESRLIRFGRITKLLLRCYQGKLLKWDEFFGCKDQVWVLVVGRSYIVGKISQSISVKLTSVLELPNLLYLGGGGGKSLQTYQIRHVYEMRTQSFNSFFPPKDTLGALDTPLGQKPGSNERVSILILNNYIKGLGQGQENVLNV